MPSGSYSDGHGEHGGVREQTGSPRAWPASPRSRSTPARRAPQFPGQFADLGRQLGRVRLARADHQLRGRIEVGGPPAAAPGAPFCRVTRPTKITGRPGPGRPQYRSSHAGRRVGGVLDGCRLPLRMTRIRPAGTAGYAASTSSRMPSEDRDDRRRGLDRGPLAPGGTARSRPPSCSALPRPASGSSEVRGDHVRDPVEQAGQVARQVRVPGVRVHQVGGGPTAAVMDRSVEIVCSAWLALPRRVPGPVRDRPRTVRALAVPR